MKKPKPIELIHVSDIHFGSGELHGKLNPETGLNVRLEDFCRAFQKCVDYALSVPADVFLFSGDAYRNASPEPIYQKLFAEQLRRLSEANIKTILVVGNHDQIFKSSASHSMSVFQSLAVPNLLIIDKPQLLRLDTAHGALQIVGIPYVTRNLLMTHEAYATLTNAEIERVLAKHLSAILTNLYEELDPNLPTVATAHIMLDRARAGAEQELLVGYTTTFPLSLFTDSRLDYVALGHVHRHQTLHDQPPVVYAGSIERVDFGEESEDKGFVHARIARKETSYEFHSIEPRPFVTVDADLTESKNPTADLLRRLEGKDLKGVVLRIRYKILEHQTPLLDEAALRDATAPALVSHFKPEIIAAERESRIPGLTESTANAPITALETYLDSLSPDPDRKARLLQKANDLWSKLQ